MFLETVLGCMQWRSSYLAVLALRQGRQAAKGRQNEALQSGCRTVSNNGSGSGLAPTQNILAV